MGIGAHGNAGLGKGQGKLRPDLRVSRQQEYGEGRYRNGHAAPCEEEVGIIAQCPSDVKCVITAKIYETIIAPRRSSLAGWKVCMGES